MSIFQFKHFQIHQDNAALKVGTDSMLLGALCQFDNLNNLLDIGTGTGVLALMCAQRFSPNQIVAIDPGEEAIALASKNFEHSSFNTQFETLQTRLQDLNHTPFDGIICNPPYFEESTKNPDPNKTMARHTDELSLVDVAKHVVRLLKPSAKFWMVYPYLQREKLYSTFHDNALFLADEIILCGKPDEPNRVIVCFSAVKTILNTSVFTIRERNGQYTEAYKELTKEFHDRAL